MPVGADGFRLPTVTEEASKPKIEVLAGPSQCDTFQTFVIQDEDHTLGNALKHILLEDPAVLFGGYVVPHPMERRIQVRIQTVAGESAVSVLKRSLLKLKQQNLAVKKMIQEEVERYKAAHPDHVQ
ncbi:DNA-directed RNA polymerases I and III subunit RPAC2 [Hyalella azteca]|uniref:DNA-directed RNA polymerase I subunit D n=1 Tax=Hyalella azteca TaxID=294128 RepID=A0A8B7PMR4_HYAAZ|nr:DNA-directed RNA polymerases I and III subunit RPAC2 [Hyalella azteca]